MSKWIRSKKLSALFKIASDSVNITTFNGFKRYVNMLKAEATSIGIGYETGSTFQSGIKNGEENGTFIEYNPNSKCFPNLRIGILEGSTSFDVDRCNELIKAFFMECYNKFSSKREMLYFVNFHKRDSEKFFYEANSFFENIKYLNFGKESGSHYNSKDKTIYIKLGSEPEVSVRHEMYHYFKSCFTELDTPWYEKRNFESKEYYLDNRIRSNIDPIGYGPFYNYKYDDIDRAVRPYLSNPDEYIDSDYFDSDIYIQDICSISEELYKQITSSFLELQKNKIKQGFLKIYNSALEYAKDEKIIEKNKLITDEEKHLFAIAYIHNNFYSQKSFDWTFRYEVLKTSIQRIASRKYGINNFADIYETIDDTTRECFYEYFKDYSNYKKSKDDNIFLYFEKETGIHKEFFEYAKSNFPDFAKEYESCKSKISIINAYEDKVKVYEDKKYNELKGKLNSVGQPLDNSNYGDEFQRMTLDYRSQPSKDNILKVMKKHFSDYEYKDITTFKGEGGFVPDDYNVADGKGKPARGLDLKDKYDDFSDFSSENLNHMYTFNHQDLSVRTFYDFAEKKGIDSLDPQTYEDFFKKLLKLEFDNSYYKDVDVCRVVIPLMHNPDRNAYALSTYYDLAKNDFKNSDSVPV